MDASVIRTHYERFVTALHARTVRIDYDAPHDSLYVFGEEPWRPDVHQKPRTFAVNSGIRIDLLLSNNRVYGAEIDDFGAALARHGGGALISWWDGLPKDDPVDVDGDLLAEVIQHLSFAQDMT